MEYNKEKVYKMMRHNRIRYYAPADYSDGSELDTLVKSIIRKTAAYELLEKEHIKDKREAELITSDNDNLSEVME
nr:hypothetical protein [Veillonella agrestimuris]